MDTDASFPFIPQISREIHQEMAAMCPRTFDVHTLH